MQQRFRFILPLISLTIAGQAFAAANFTIAPKAGTTLPTSIAAGGMVFAYYTITNNTHSLRSGYEVRGLPSSVVQITGPNLCTIPINLAAGASCTLQLNINAAVQSSFAICKGSSCTSASASASLNVSGNTSPPFIAAGGYLGNTSSPLIASSNDNGNTWLYTLTGNSTLPSFAAPKKHLAPITPQIVLRTANCTTTSCIAVGSFPAGSTPFIARSTNGGNTWTFPVSATHPAANQPVPFESGTFIGESCNGPVCIATGMYKVSGVDNAPMLANSLDNGATWTYQIDNAVSAAQLSDYFGVAPRGGLTSVSCGSTACIASGSYTSSSASFIPMVAASNANGTGWRYTAFQNQQLPDNLELGQYNSSFCNGSVCFVGGSYRTSVATYPVIGRSTDGGITWSFPISASGPLPDPDIETGMFNNISCNGTTCIAVGNYSTSSSSNQPVIAVSNDNGQTWTYKLNASISMQGDTLLTGRFVSASCSNTACIAVGAYQGIISPMIFKPLIATSNDGGQTWSYTLNGTMPLPNGSQMNSSVLGGAQCFNNTCIAAGAYSDAINFYPLLALSNNSGKTWTYKIYSASPALPQPYNGQGYLIGASLS